MLLGVPEGKSSLLAGLRGPPRKQAVRGWEDLEKWTPPSSSREKPGVWWLWGQGREAVPWVHRSAHFCELERISLGLSFARRPRVWPLCTLGGARAMHECAKCSECPLGLGISET